MLGRRGGAAPSLQLPLPLPLLLLLLLTAIWLDPAAASEFPERECCDSIPPLPAQFTTPPVSGATRQQEASPSTTSKPKAVSTKTSPPIIDCKLARQLCQRNPACRYITSIIPRLCGQELVACSTVTVAKCRAALRTLVAFQFFQPTCLCKERRVDPECNTYRSLVFDHPCLSVNELDKDPFPTQALPTCEYALNACHQQRNCSRVYQNYIRQCPFEDGVCYMSNSSACFEAWISLKKFTPVFGCICTNLHDWNCERTFKAVHNNPCVVTGLGGSGGGRRSTDPQLMTPLFDLTSERPRTSTMERTLYGQEDEDPDNPLALDEQQKTMSQQGTPGPDSAAADDVFQSSCHTALDNCRRDRHCSLKLEPVLANCASSSCNRQRCMARLQDFYGESDNVLVLDAAFCVCRHSPDGDGTCVAAMEQLHPTCAHQPESGSLPACHRVARHCQRQPDGRCRPRLERYEQACAVDVVTGRCAGPSSHCRQAVLAVLGTRLRVQCACEGVATTFSQQSCRDWARLLWDNSCVELSQREYLRRQLSGSPLHGPAAPSQPSQTETVSSAREQRRQATPTGSGRLVPASSAGGATVRPRQPHCVARKQGRPDDHIFVGSGVRYYRLGESEDEYRADKDCSELCMCHGRDRLVCNVLDCVEKKDCQSSLAVYHHGSAGLLPFREGCICHHGDFVCMRPPADDYTLPFGVFLFLGYSKTDEEMLYPHTHKTVKEHVIEELERMIGLVMERNSMHVQDWKCSLSVKQHFVKTDNIIIQAKLRQAEAQHNQSVSQELLNREKEECTGPLREISFMVNNREPAILSHPLLSVFKMADLEVTIPDLSAAGPGRQPLTLPALCLLLLAVCVPPT